MKVIYRRAIPEDIPDCLLLRGKTRENAFSIEQLEAIGITLGSWRSSVENGSLPGYVSTVDGNLAGFCFGDGTTGEIAVLALLPEYEGNGIGKALLNLMIEEFRGMGFRKLFLGCSRDPHVRSYGFYRHLGWKPTGTLDALNDGILEYFLCDGSDEPP